MIIAALRNKYLHTNHDYVTLLVVKETQGVPETLD